MTKGTLLIEKRQRSRLSMVFPVNFSILGDRAGQKNVINGHGADINAGGIRLVAAQRLAAKTRLEVQIILPDELPPMNGRAMVVWVKDCARKRGRPPEYQMGLKFKDISSRSEDMITRFMLDNIKRISKLH